MSGKRHRQQPKENDDAVKKGLSLCYTRVLYIIEETLSETIRKVMSSHVNDRSVCSVQNECPLICKALPLRV